MTDDPASPSAALAALAGEYWEWCLEVNPTFATAVGDRRHDDRLEDWSAEGVAGRRAALERFAAAVGAIEPSGLDRADATTRSELASEIGAERTLIETGVHEWTVDPLEGPQVNFLNIESFQPVETPGQGVAMAARWRAMGPAIDTHIANLRRAAADGRIAAADPVGRAIDELDELLAGRDGDWALLRPATVDRPDWSERDRSAFAASLHEAVADAVRPAFVRLRAALADEILPVARPADRAGIGHLPGGAAAYRRLIRIHTTLDIGAEELHATGLREIDRIDGELVELGDRVLGTAGLAATLERLRTDPSLSFATGDEVAAKAAEALARATEAIPDWFGRLPRAACEVVRMAAHEERHSTIAYYRQPAGDGSRPGRYYINTSEPGTRPRYEAEALAYHEAIPGHHLQIAIAQELDELPDFRRHLGSTAFAEGWALYVERLADEMDLYTGDLDRIGIRSFDAWRASRLVVDTGLHALGWTRDRAIDYMLEHTALGPNNVVNEVDRYIVWPGQALAYKTGQLEILRLRSEAEAGRGPWFDARSFHDAVLGSGAVGMGTLREIIRRWIREDDRAAPSRP